MANNRLTEYDCYRALVELCEIRYFQANKCSVDTSSLDNRIVDVLINLREIRQVKSDMREAKRAKNARTRSRLWLKQ